MLSRKEKIREYVKNNIIKLEIIGFCLFVSGLIFFIILCYLNSDEQGFLRNDAPIELILLGLIPVVIGFLIIIIPIAIIGKIAGQMSNNTIKLSQMEQEQAKQDVTNPLQARSGVDNYFFHRVINSHKKRLAERHLSLADEKEFWEQVNIFIPIKNSMINADGNPNANANANANMNMLNFHKIRRIIKFFYEHDATTPETAISLNEFFKDYTLTNSQTRMYITNEIINYNQDCTIYLDIPRIKYYFKLFSGSFLLTWAIISVVSFSLPEINWILFVPATIILIPTILYYSKLIFYLLHYKRKYQK